MIKPQRKNLITAVKKPFELVTKFLLPFFSMDFMPTVNDLKLSTAN